MNKTKPKHAILVVDDTPGTVEVIQRNLHDQGYAVYIASSAVEALDFLESTSVDLVITDLKMPRVSGMELVMHIRENHANTEVMMITGYATVQSAVEAVKCGAEEYLAKPFTDEELFNAVRRILEKLEKRRASEKCTPADNQ
ncbi:MAG: response regulator, partial [Chitinispirillaceae bacterium]|nr:response regulator [Chitinispirillaceae bacterium]